MALKSRVASSNPEDAFQGAWLDKLLEQNSNFKRIFYFAQVINNVDESNLNRIQVRIPVIDDVFYQNIDKGGGDAALPYCLPFSSRFLETPENNQIIVVAVFDVNTPYYGRIYFDSITGLSATDLFDQLTPEEQYLSDWLNAENTISSIVPKPKSSNEFNVQNNVDFVMGIRGKGNNKVELDDVSVHISQNDKNPKTESFIDFKENTTLEAAVELHMRSKKGTNVEYHPVFDQKTYDYMDAMMKMMEKIILVFNSTPAISPSGPCLPSTQGQKLINELMTLKQQLSTFKKIGASKELFIN